MAIIGTIKPSVALDDIKAIVQRTCNEAVYQKEFQGLMQREHETIAEYHVRIRDCAMDCGFICPFDDTHDLTDHNILLRLRCGLFNKVLQQEVLQKAQELNTITDMIEYCEGYEAAKRDSKLLTDEQQKPSIAATAASNDSELTEENVVAAISNYKKEKFADRRSTFKSTLLWI